MYLREFKESLARYMTFYNTESDLVHLLNIGHPINGKVDIEKKQSYIIEQFYTQTSLIQIV